ncbi:MAG: methyltransferase domain-containing protein, partial [Bacteroidetes bacterium]|nr:methyltransferase domain-containing protein [Bacteroidota bacterium]
LACELNLADILRNRPKTIEEIANESETHPASLYRLMRALAGEGIFRELRGKTFANTKLSLALTDDAGSMKFMIQHQLNDTNWDMIGKLQFSVATKKNAAREVLGTDIFDHLSRHPDKNELYNKAMTNTSDLSGAAILSAYSFRNLKKIADIGGGEGHLLANILKKYPKSQGILFDFDHVVASAAETFKRTGTAGRVQITGGNFFETVPSGCDAYIMKNILHAFDDLTCIMLLKNIHQNTLPGTRLLIIEAVIGEINKPQFGKLFDLQMLLGTDGGKERTKSEFITIIEEAGFRFKRVISTVSPFSIVEAVKM